MQIQAGTRLGPYEIVAPIGAGGMGQVFRARDTRLERDVAVKVLPDAYATDASFLARFEREAKAISSLNHPHICTLHDVGADGGVRFLVMEMIEGESLGDRLARGRLDMDQVLRIGAEVASALDAAHRRQIVHRDLKPANVMLTRSGAKLLDFGLAKSDGILAGAVAGSTEVPTQLRPLTEQGTILGTFQYMAPEQLEGQEADARTDIFALGALLYEMATGQRAFEGRTRTSLIAAIVAGTPRPMAEVVPMAPPAFEHVVRRCLEKDRDARWQSAHDVAEQLRFLAAGSLTGVPAPVARRRLSLERALAVALAAALVAVGALAARGRRTAVVPAYALTIPGLTQSYARAGLAVVSPDGTRVAFVATRKDGKRLVWVRRLDSFSAVPIEGTEAARYQCWSPDGRDLAFESAGKLLRVSADGGPVQPVADLAGLPLPEGLGWGTAGGQGVLLVGSMDSGLHRVPAAGGAIEPLTKPEAARGERGHTYPRFLRDGRRFTYVATGREPGSGDLVTRLWLGALDGQPRPIGSIGSEALFDETSGHLLYVNEGTLVAARFDAASARLVGEPIPVLDDVAFTVFSGAVKVSMSTAGLLTAQSSARGNRLHWLDLSGRKLSLLADVPVGAAFSFTPDGRRVIAVVADRQLGTNDLFAFDAARKGGTRLTYTRFFEGAPAVSPDGRYVYYTGSRKGSAEIWRKALDGSSEDEELLARRANQFPADVAPDGRWLLYLSNEDPSTRTDLWLLPLAGGGEPVPFVRSPFEEGAARFSPDGRQVAYASDESGRSQIYVRPFPGPGPARQVSQGGGSIPCWSGDGRSLYFLAEGRVMRARQPFDSEPELLFENPEIVSFQLAPDGERILAVMTSDLEASPPTRVLTDWRALLTGR